MRSWRRFSVQLKWTIIQEADPFVMLFLCEGITEERSIEIDEWMADHLPARTFAASGIVTTLDEKTSARNQRKFIRIHDEANAAKFQLVWGFAD